VRVRILAEAETEAQEAALWYEQQRQGLGVEFLDSFEGALRAIEITPQGFTRIRRIWPLPRSAPFRAPAIPLQNYL
jgi:hypothetical protein